MHHNRSSIFAAVMMLSASLVMAAPEIYVEKPDFDAGTLTRMDTLERKMYIQNRGDEDLVINRIDGCSGDCKSHVIETDRIKPGKKAWVKFSFDLYTESEKVWKKREIHSNDPERPSIPLTFKASIVDRYRVEPRLLFLKVSEKGRAVAGSVIIRALGLVTGELTSAECDSEHLTTSLEKLKRSGEYLLTVETSDSFPEGQTIGECTLSGDDDSVPKCRVRVSAYRKAKFTVLPKQLALLPVAREQLRVIFIRQSSEERAKLLDVTTDIEGARIEINPERAGGDYRVYVRIKGLSGKKGPLGTVTLKFDRETNPEVTIPVAVRGVVLED